MSKQYKIQFLFFLLLFSNLGAAQNFYFKQISIEEGMSQSTVQSIMCDSKQTLWFGTKNGLNRFDGYELKSYFSIPRDSTSIPGNNIFFLLEDALNEIWIGTQNGICRYDFQQDKFKSAFSDGKPIYSHCYSAGKEGITFIGNGRIYQYDYHTRKINCIPMTGEGKNEYFTLCQNLDNETALVAGRFTKPYLLNVKTGETQLFTENDIQNVTALFIENNQRVWIAQYNKGVCALDRKGNILTRYTTENSRLSSNIILNLLLRQEQLWMATDGGGISLLDLNTKKFSHIEYIPGEINTLPVNSITCLYEDNENNVWAGSVRGGAFGIRNVNMRTYSDMPLGSSKGLSNKSVICLFKEDENVLWIGTDGGGINRLDISDNQFTHYPGTYKEKVNSIYELNKEELLLSIYGKGLYRFNKKSGHITLLPVIDKHTTDSIYSVGPPIIIHPGKPGKLYLLGVGMYILDIHTLTFQAVRYSPTPWVQPFYHSKEYSYAWSYNTVFKLDHKTNSYEEIWKPEDAKLITCACFDNAHTLYIGTTTGLLRYDIETGKSEQLSDLYLTSIFYENQNRIWIGAQNKLFVYNSLSQHFATFDRSDGVSPNELFARPVCITSTSDIYMGGSAGLLHICENNMLQDISVPQLMLSRINRDHHPLEVKGTTIEELTVPWNFENIQFHFVVKENNFFRERKFKYTISGGSGLSVMESDKPVLSLNSLPAGKYRIAAQCDMQNGEWTQPIVCALLTITPPWWKSVWAILFYILLGAASLCGVILYHIRKNKLQLKTELEMHEQKTKEEKIQFLINISHELRTPLTLIYTSLKRMIVDKESPSAENAQLKSIFKQAQRMKNIINMVLDVRKIEVGKERLNLNKCKLNEWITSLTNDFKIEFESQNIKLQLELDNRIEDFILDQEKSEKAFTNLLMNALKFSDLHSCIKVVTLRMENGIRISIIDQGIGLGEHPDKIFQRFYQGDHNRGGTGIGLSYSKLMIEMQGGTIWAHNNQDAGATFNIELPERSQTDKSVHKSETPIDEQFSSSLLEKVDVEEFPLRQYSLLVVEDEPELRLFLKKSFEERFGKVYIAENGESGFEQVVNCRPDIVVSDVMMPIMNGYELCKLIKNDLRCSHIPVVLLTAVGDVQNIVAGYKIGADVYLPKPFDEEVLISIVQTLIRNREYVKKKYKDTQCGALIPQEITFSDLDEKFIGKLNKLIISHIDSADLDVGFLAREMGMSRSSLYNKINQLLDVTVGDYINKQRMLTAEHLVVHTNMSMQEIAERTGFSTQRYFSQVFKGVYGVPPSKYRVDNHS